MSSTWSARRSAAGRCETTRQVTSRPRAKRRVHSSASVSASSAEERSSKTSSSASRTNIRAAAARWTWPPESFTPRGPTSVSSPRSSAARSGSSTAAWIAASSAAGSSGRPSSRFSRSVSLNSRGTCGV